MKAKWGIQETDASITRQGRMAEQTLEVWAGINTTNKIVDDMLNSLTGVAQEDGENRVSMIDITDNQKLQHIEKLIDLQYKGGKLKHVIESSEQIDKDVVKVGLADTLRMFERQCAGDVVMYEKLVNGLVEIWNKKVSG